MGHYITIFTWVLVLYGLAAWSVHPPGVTPVETSVLDLKQQITTYFTSITLELHSQKEAMKTTAECATFGCYLRKDPFYLGGQFSYMFAEIVITCLVRLGIVWSDIFVFIPGRCIYRAFLDLSSMIY